MVSNCTQINEILIILFYLPPYCIFYKFLFQYIISHEILLFFDSNAYNKIYTVILSFHIINNEFINF